MEEFPDLSFCPMFSFLEVGEIDINAILVDNTTFKEEYNHNMISDDSIIEYSHYNSGNIKYINNRKNILNN